MNTLNPVVVDLPRVLEEATETTNQPQRNTINGTPAAFSREREITRGCGESQTVGSIQGASNDFRSGPTGRQSILLIARREEVMWRKSCGKLEKTNQLGVNC